MSREHVFRKLGFTVSAVCLALTQTGCGNTPNSSSAAVFTANEDGQSISVVNLSTNQVTTSNIGISPHNVQISSDGRTLFAVGSAMVPGATMDEGMAKRGRLLIFAADRIPNGPTTDIEVGQQPTHVIVDAQGAHAFVPNAGDNTLSVIDVRKRQVIKSIPVGRSPHGLRMSPDKQSIYIANTGAGTVSIVSVLDLREVARVPVGRGPVQVAFTPDGKHAYVSLRDENSVAVIDTASRGIVAKIRVGRGPIQVFAAPSGRELYVANQGTKAAPANTMSIIDTATRKVIGEVVTGAGAHGVVVSGDGSSVFVTNAFANTVSIVDMSKRKVISVSVGAGPGGVTYAAAR